VCNFGSKGEKGRGGNISIIFAEGETLKDRSTGRIFEVKKRTGSFLILQSLDGLTQVLTGEKSISDFFQKTLNAGSRTSEMDK
jgi:hypothetical protein